MGLGKTFKLHDLLTFMAKLIRCRSTATEENHKCLLGILACKCTDEWTFTQAFCAGGDVKFAVQQIRKGEAEGAKR